MVVAASANGWSTQNGKPIAHIMIFLKVESKTIGGDKERNIILFFSFLFLFCFPFFPSWGENRSERGEKKNYREFYQFFAFMIGT